MVSALPLVGRQGDVEQVAALMGALVSGEGGALVLEGEVGIGKSRLVAELVAVAESHGLRLLQGGAHELGASRPFGPLLEALGDLAPEGLGRLEADAGELGVGEMGVEVAGAGVVGVDALVTGLEAAARDNPTLLVVEDVHLADAATVTALGALTRRLARVAVGLVVTARPLPRSAGVDRLLAAVEAAGGRVHRLGPLAEADAERLLEILVGESPGPGLRRQAAAAGGNPLYLVELVAALRAEEAITTVDGVADTPRQKLPATLRHTILRRLGYLSAPTLSVLEAAAVLGVGFDVEDLAAVAELSPAGLLSPLEEARRAGVVMEGSGGKLCFSHELVRDALYQELAGPLARSLHRRFARRLAGAGAPAAVVGAQYALGAERVGDIEAVSWLARAGREVSGVDPASASSLFRRAVDLTATGSPERDGLSVELAMALARAGRAAEAESTAKEVLGRPHDRSLDAALQLAMGRALLARGRTQEAIGAFEVAGADRSLPAPGRGQALAEVALGRVFAGDLPGAEGAARRLLALAERSGDELAACVGLCALALLADCRADVHEALALASRAVGVADASPAGQAHWFPSHLYQAYFLMDDDHLEEATEVLRAGREAAERLGAVANLPAYHFGAGVAGFLGGAFDDASVEIEAGLALAKEIGIPSGTAWAHSLASIMAVHRDELDAAEVSLAAAEAARGAGSQPFWHWSIWAAAGLAEARGDLSTALSTQAALVDGCLAAGSRYELVNLGPDLVRLSLAAGETGRAKQTSTELAEVADTAGTRNAAAAALWCRGLVETDPDSLVAAAVAYEQAGWNMCAASAAVDAAEALGRAGRREQAFRLFAKAVAGFEAAGAARDLARTRAAQRSLGLHPGARGPRVRAKTGWASFTPTEARIAALAADGLTSAEIARRACVSVRTVDGHLGRVFAKLGVRSRAQLAAAARTEAPGSGTRPPGLLRA